MLPEALQDFFITAHAVLKELVFLILSLFGIYKLLRREFPKRRKSKSAF